MIAAQADFSIKYVEISGNIMTGRKNFALGSADISCSLLRNRDGGYRAMWCSSVCARNHLPVQCL